MTKIRIQDLQGAALDWVTAKAEGLPLSYDAIQPGSILVGVGDGDLRTFAPATDWAQGGPIIERECVEVVIQTGSDDRHRWAGRHYPFGGLCTVADGPTPLIAAMRAYAAGKLGREVDVPEELL